MKKIILILIIGTSLILAATFVLAEEEHDMTIHIEYWYFRSIEEISEMTSDIVQLEILDERAEWINIWEGREHPSERDLNDVYTIHRARVLNVFQGDLVVNDVIEIMQEGGSLDGTTLRNPSMVNFSYGDNVVLFLHNPVDFPFTIINPYQGAYHIGEDGSLSRYHDDSPGNLGLTWDILEQIQHENGIEATPTTVESNNIKKIGIIVTGTILATVLIILIMCRRNREKAKDKG